MPGAFSSSSRTFTTTGSNKLTLVSAPSTYQTDLGGGHAFATIYTASKSERVLVTAFDQATLVATISRAMEGTTAREWPTGACVSFGEIVPDTVCPDIVEGACRVVDILGGIQVGKGLTIDRTNPENPVIALATTGVVPTAIACGAEIDDCGRFVFVPDNWPASCASTYNPCCDPGAGAGGSTDAYSVTFATGSSAGIVTGATVGAALTQIEDYIGSLGAGGATGVTAVTAGTGILLSGASSAPTINIQPTGISAGTYDGFTIDATGRVTGYAPPTVANTIVVGTAPVAAAYNAGTLTYTVSVGQASTSDFGVVKLADAGNISTPVLIGEDDVVTWDFLQAWATSKGI